LLASGRRLRYRFTDGTQADRSPGELANVIGGNMKCDGNGGPIFMPTVIEGGDDDLRLKSSGEAYIRIG
jgi:hypothetical protein